MARNIKVLNRQYYPADSVIMKEGDIGDKAFFIEDGLVEVFKQDAHGDEFIIARVGTNSIIGEMSVIKREIRGASIRAIKDCVLVPITVEDFNRVLNTSDKAFRALIEILVDRLDHANKKLSQQAFDIDTLEEAAQTTMNHMSRMLSSNQQESFQSEFKPIISSLRDTVDKYTEPTAKEERTASINQ